MPIKKIIVGSILAIFFSAPLALGRDRFSISPGYMTTGFKKGWELSILHCPYCSDGRGSGFGLVVGTNITPEEERFIEFEHYAHDYTFLGFTIGGGAYESIKGSGIQTTAGIFPFTPFLIFTRLQLQISPTLKMPRPMIGLMFKLPVPIIII